MEARDGSDRIRPLPPDLPDVATPGSEKPSRRHRRWMPLAVAGGALVVFGVISGVLARSDAPPVPSADNETGTTLAGLGAPPPPPTTTTTAAPSLQAMIPDLQSDIEIVYVAGDATNTVTWRREQAATGPTRGVATPADVASFDAAQTELLLVTGNLRRTLWLGNPFETEPIFVDIKGAAWHPGTPSTLAWIGRLTPSDDYRLMTATTLSSSIGLDIINDLGPVPASSRLVAWGDWGFLLAVDVPPELRRWAVPDRDTGEPGFQLLEFALVLDPAGTQLAAFPASPKAANVTGHIVAQPAPGAYQLATAAGIDPAELGLQVPVTPLERGPAGEPVIVLRPSFEVENARFVPRSASSTYAFAPDGETVSMIGEVEGRLRIESVSLDGSVKRIASVEGADRYVGHSSNGRFVVVADSTDGRIVFHDWNRGSSFSIPFDAGEVLTVGG